MFEKLLDIFREEELELETGEAADVYRERKEKELDDARKKSRKIRSSIDDAMRELSGALEKMEDHSDYGDRKIVEDVMENIGSERRELVETTELPEDPEELEKSLENFMEEFYDLSQKEEAVMEEAVLPESFEKSVNRLEKQVERLEKFLEKDFGSVKTLRRLEKKISKIEELQREKEDIREKISNDRIDELREKKEERREELKELKESERWEEYVREKENLEELGSQKKEERKKLEKALGNMRRGLKKFLYQVENGDIELESPKKIVEDMRDKNTSEILERDAEKVEKAAEELEEKLPDDLLSESQRKKFLGNIETVKDIDQLEKRIRDIEREIEEKETLVSENQVIEKKKRLEKEIEEKENMVQERQEDLKDLKSRLDRKKRELSRIRDEVREELSESIRADIVFPDESREMD